MKTGFAGFSASLRRDIPWQSKVHKALLHACAAALALYLTYVLYWGHSALLSGLWATAAALAWGLLIAALLYVGFMWACRRIGGLAWVLPQKKRLNPLFFAASMGLGLLLLSGAFMAAYPGGVSYDVYNQWIQARTGLYNSWHPVLHTLMMGVGIKLLGSYPWVVALQILCFCAALAYLAATLEAWGLPKALLLVWEGLTVSSSLVSGALLYLWKDNAMTLGAMVLCAQSVNLYLSRGAWLKRWPNAALMGLALAFVTLVRHNGMLYTVPLLLCVMLGYGRPVKRLLPLAGAFALALGLVQGSLYGSLDVVHPHNTYEESIGLPMTILLDARAQNPSILQEETRAFLTGLVEEETFQASYVPGDYNSIKFRYPREKIHAVPPAKLLGMVASAVRQDPRLALESVNAVTGLVWDVTGKNQAVVTVGNSGDLAEVPAQNGRLNRLGRAWDGLLRGVMAFAPLRWLFENIGVQMALLLLATLWALYRKGPRALLLCLPVLLYNLGTMLLLCGNDARFFQFAMVVSLPSILALCQRRPGSDAPVGLSITDKEA